jgi:hypothetical protein
MADKLPDKFEAEILSVGVWNGIKITREMLSQIVDNFTKFKSEIRSPLKLGHESKVNNKELKGGQPALGEVSNVKLSGEKLIASFKDVPEIVMEAITKKLFKRVSSELILNFKKGKEVFGSVLTGVAILGSEIPAVKNLKDLQAFLSDDGEILDISDGVVVFEETTAITNDKGGEEDMNDEIKKLEDEKRDMQVQHDAEAKKLADEKAELTAKLEKFETERVDAEKSASVEDIKAFCEDAVKGMKMTPASRDIIVKHLDTALFSEDNEATLSVAVFKEFVGAMDAKDTDEKGSSKGDEKPEDLDSQIDAAMAKFKEANPKITDEAVIFNEVMKADDKLAAEYIKTTL